MQKIRNTWTLGVVQAIRVLCDFGPSFFWLQYFGTPIRLFLTRGVETSNIFILKFIIQGLLQLCNKNISFYLTKTKALFMASIGKTTLNIDDLTIHSA